MKTKTTWFDRIMAAVTFAEANEQDTGRKLLDVHGRREEREQKCTECEGVLTTDLHGAEAHS